MEREGREGEVGRRRREGEGRGRRGGEMRKGIVIGGMAILLVLGCNNGAIEELEKKSSFFDAVVKIGHGFQDIFVVFGDAIGDKLGFNAVKSDDTRDKVGTHFEKVKQGLEGTKKKLEELSGEISSTKNVDGNTTKVIEEAIKGANGVFDKLIGFLTKLDEVAKGASSHAIGDSSSTNAAGADPANINTIIENIKGIVDIAEQAKVDIKLGTPGSQVAAGIANAPAALVKSNAQASAGAGAKLADEVAKADPWVMINKIKSVTSATIKSGELSSGDHDAGALATGTDNSGDDAAAKTVEDLAAAIALKAMTKSGKFNASSDSGVAVKAAAANAVNKVLGVLDEIIRRTVAKNLEKVREAVKGINYSDTNAEATEVKK